MILICVQFVAIVTTINNSLQAMRAERRVSRFQPKPKFFELKEGQAFGQDGEDKKVRKEKK